MSEYKITREDGPTRGRYVIDLAPGAEAEMTYRREEGRIIVDHTGVPDALRGKGVGQALAAHAVESARKGGWKIMPLCPFFRAQAMRHKEWHDVVNL